MNRLATRSLAARPAHTPERIWHRQHIIDWPAFGYVLVIASGALGCLDIIYYGATSAGRIVEISPFNQLVWPLAYLLFAWLTLRRWPDVLDAAIRTWWILLVPIVAVLSVLWSIDPVTSANEALRLAVSAIIGLYIGATFGLRGIVRAVFWVLMVTVGLSVLVVFLGLDFAIMFDGKARGIFYHKNQLGNRGFLLIVAALVLWIVHKRASCALAGIVLGILTLGLAQSATSIVAATAGVAAVFGILALRADGLVVAFRLALLGAGLVVGAFLCMTVIDPMSLILDLLDRDPTMTGRTHLWEAVWGQIARRPLLGTGFEAFWASAIDWQTLQVLEAMGDVGDLHNTYLELWVNLGLLGLVTALIALIAMLKKSFSLALEPEGLPAVWGFALTTSLAVCMLAEREVFLKHSFTGILVTATAVAIVRGTEALASSRTLQRAGIVRGQFIQKSQFDQGNGTTWRDSKRR
jgi:exopolysaccharide production protein ExoQ